VSLYLSGCYLGLTRYWFSVSLCLSRHRENLIPRHRRKSHPAGPQGRGVREGGGECIKPFQVSREGNRTPAPKLQETQSYMAAALPLPHGKGQLILVVVDVLVICSPGIIAEISDLRRSFQKTQHSRARTPPLVCPASSQSMCYMNKTETIKTSPGSPNEGKLKVET